MLWPVIVLLGGFLCHPCEGADFLGITLPSLPSCNWGASPTCGYFLTKFYGTDDCSGLVEYLWIDTVDLAQAPSGGSGSTCQNMTHLGVPSSVEYVAPRLTSYSAMTTAVENMLCGEYYVIVNWINQGSTRYIGFNMRPILTCSSPTALGRITQWRDSYPVRYYYDKYESCPGSTRAVYHREFDGDSCGKIAEATYDEKLTCMGTDVDTGTIVVKKSIVNIQGGAGCAMSDSERRALLDVTFIPGTGIPSEGSPSSPDPDPASASAGEEDGDSSSSATAVAVGVTVPIVLIIVVVIIIVIVVVVVVVLMRKKKSRSKKATEVGSGNHPGGGGNANIEMSTSQVQQQSSNKLAQAQPAPAPMVQYAQAPQVQQGGVVQSAPTGPMIQYAQVQQAGVVQSGPTRPMVQYAQVPQQVQQGGVVQYAQVPQQVQQGGGVIQYAPQMVQRLPQQQQVYYYPGQQQMATTAPVYTTAYRQPVVMMQQQPGVQMAATPQQQLPVTTTAAAVPVPAPTVTTVPAPTVAAVPAPTVVAAGGEEVAGSEKDDPVMPEGLDAGQSESN